MGFTAIKAKAVGDLLSANFQHEVRNHIDEKNWLATGQVEASFVADILKQTRSHECVTSPHHQDSAVDVHTVVSRGWYIKFYFSPDILFISVHPEGI